MTMTKVSLFLNTGTNIDTSPEEVLNSSIPEEPIPHTTAASKFVLSFYISQTGSYVIRVLATVTRFLFHTYPNRCIDFKNGRQCFCI